MREFGKLTLDHSPKVKVVKKSSVRLLIWNE